MKRSPKLPNVDKRKRDILAIDPGIASCGWAVRVGGVLASGAWKLKAGRMDSYGMRYVRLLKYLDEIGPVHRMYFEEVKRHEGTESAHLYGGIVATLTSWAEINAIQYAAIPVGSIKKTATGKGNAGKDLMLSSAIERWPDQEIETHDQADALWILETALIEYEP